MTRKEYKKRLVLTDRELKTPKPAMPEEIMKSVRKVLPQDIIKRSYKSEKAMRVMEKENTLVFECDLKANKPEIKEAIEKLYGVRPKKVNTAITFGGQKKAYAIFGPEHSAVEIASNADLI